MRVAVTGAMGFTGRYLLPELTARGHVAFSLAADLTNPVALAEAIDAGRPDAIIHLAARAFLNVADFNDFYAVNQVGSFNLLQAAADRCPGARVILASTAQVYGAQAQGLIAETQPVTPNNHYALSKAAMEIGSRLWTDRLRLMIVRPFNYTGVGQETRYLVPKIVDHFRRRADTIELGNIDVRRDFGDVRSVAEAYATLLESDNEFDVINIATGSAASVRDVVYRLEAITGHRIEVQVNPAFMRANDVPMLAGSIGRLSIAAPDWRPRTLDETLTWMIQSAN